MNLEKRDCKYIYTMIIRKRLFYKYEMHTLSVKKLCSNNSKKFSYALRNFSVIFVPDYFTSVCGVLAPMTSL